jgi:formylmethanofuran dehydrogenase subunit E
MGTVPEHELVALSAMSGYDQTLEIERLCQVYNVDEMTLRAAMASIAPTEPNGATPTDRTWDTAHKAIPGLEDARAPTAPTLVDKRQFRFEYDPTKEASQRREQVNQAILCSACGVALGIPDIRPIKVTCPSCLFESTYTH